MKDCIFCKIIAGRIPSRRVYEDDLAFAFMDIGPIRPGHLLLIPKQHCERLTDLPEKLAAHLGRLMPRLARAVIAAANADGLNIHQTNGACSGQVVPHLHFHLIPRHDNDGYSFNWRPGQYAEGEIENWGKMISDELQKQ